MTAHARVYGWPTLMLSIWGWLALAVITYAGGSGLNVVVVVNQNSSNSVALGNYYCELRSVPPQNLLRVNWTGGNTDWTVSEFDTVLRGPLVAAVASRQLTNQIDYVVLAMDFPYRVSAATGDSSTSGINGTTAALFYGFKADDCSSPNCPAGLPSCNLPLASASTYAGSEGRFRLTPPFSASNESWLVTMVTASNLAQAKALVAHGVAADFTMPTGVVFLAKSDDVNRNVRYPAFDSTLFDIELLGGMQAMRTNTGTTYGLGPMLGYANGYQSFTIYGSFLPGAMADSLTSYGGDLFGSPEHTRVLDFIDAGATASYGTVVEPCNYLAKFPSTMNYFYQARGFTIAEAYYQSLTNPYQGVIVGEPLSAPFARPATGAWVGLPENVPLVGTTNLSVHFTAVDDRRPLEQVDIFLDGRFLQTLTNFPPTPNNILYVTLNGRQTNYVVPPNANLATVASNLTLRLNANSYSNATQVAALTRGDRIELRNLNPSVSGALMALATSNSAGTAGQLTTFLNVARTNFLDTPAFGYRRFEVTNPPVAGSFLHLTLTKTNGAMVNVGVTNPPGNVDVSLLVQALVSAVNTNANLTSGDGVAAEDFYSYVFWTGGQWLSAEFNLRARSPGWAAAQLQASLTASSPLIGTPVGGVGLDENIADLRSRNHLNLTAGRSNLDLTIPFDTTRLADGYHELTAVAFEGSHVRTQKRLVQSVCIRNNSWSASLTTLQGGPNTALEATLEFAVAASTNNIVKIELFTTGGLLAASNAVSTASFTVPASYLGIGLHPFCAVVTSSDGKQYRTKTEWIRIVGADSPFRISILGLEPTLTWPAAAGRSYQILSTTNLGHTFVPRAVVTPTNSTGIWSETNGSPAPRYYRVTTP